MKLYWSPRSPFVRKVMMVLHETGQLDRVELQREVVAFTAAPNPAVLVDNPLGKIPTLVLDDGTALFDSRVICEYLDGLHSGPRLLPDGPKRMVQLRLQALADGLTEYLLLLRTERLRPDGADPRIDHALQVKIAASLRWLDGAVSGFDAAQFYLGDMALICALGQLDFRFSHSNWQTEFPELAGWYSAQSTRPTVAATAVVDDGGAASGPAAIEILDFTL